MSLTLKVINIFGAPGVGKSVTAAGLYNLMALRGHKVELIAEFAKDLTWSKDWMGLSHQPSIFAQQDYRQRRLEGQVTWVITDSPLPTGIAYMGEEYLPWLPTAIWEAYDRYENYHILLNRNKAIPYHEEGRNQTEHEASILDNTLDAIFMTAAEGEEEYAMELTACWEAPYLIYNWLEAGGDFDPS